MVPVGGGSGVHHPVRFDFEGKLALVGFDLDRRALYPGETLHLTLYWQCLSSMERDYTVFAHLLRPSGEAWAQEDKQPGATSTWQPGQIIKEGYHLVLPNSTPPGVYEIEVGVYLAETGRRLRLGPNENRVLLAKVRVLER